jgi:hypothetical protein
MSHATQTVDYEELMLAAFLKLLEERKVPMGKIDRKRYSIAWPNSLSVCFCVDSIYVEQTSSDGYSYGYCFRSLAEAAEVVRLNVDLPQNTPLPNWRLPQGMR